MPTTLGLALVDSFKQMGFNLDKPDLRAAVSFYYIDEQDILVERSFLINVKCLDGARFTSYCCRNYEKE